MRGANFTDGRLKRSAECRFVAVILPIACLAVLSCDRRDMDAIGEPDTPFVFLLSPAHATNAEDLNELAETLTEQSGMTIDVRVAESEDQAISSAGTPYFDAFLLPLFDYLFCHQEYGVEAGLQVLRHGNVREYRGDILVRADSDIQTLDDLNGKSIAFVNRYSTSGFLYPAALIRSAGITVESTFAVTHAAALDELREGRVDAAAAYHGAASESSGFRVIATTDEIPDEPVFFRHGLDVEKRAAFINALETVAGTHEGLRILGEMADITGFVPIDDAAYRDVHETIRAAEQSIQDLVPRGWLIHAENQRTLDQYAP